MPTGEVCDGVHPLAVVEAGADVGSGCRVWRWSLVRCGARLGVGVSVGSQVVIGPGVEIGAGCRIQDGAKIYGPSVLGERVFVGPGAVLSNDRYPQVGSDWVMGCDEEIRVGDGASIGTNAVILPGVSIGAEAVVGACSVVLEDVPAREMWAGVPARYRGGVRRCEETDTETC